MTVKEQSSDPGSGALLLSAMVGGLLGAAGLAWWLLAEAERRRSDPRALQAQEALDPEPIDRDLHDKVHELNQAIDEVRRQLEALGSR